ncbi:MAG: DNA-directed RNA polymerase subunit E'' [Candidatus Pacearchaeota archaeon]|nr:MAG: DNA-directed RNA polymerase subunit E'' [Candidatus Pacearchaeota archaeon]
MKKKKVCKNCKIFIEGDKCPICQGTQFVENWKGRVIITNPEKSEIAKKLNIKKRGIYAIKA